MCCNFTVFPKASIAALVFFVSLTPQYATRLTKIPYGNEMFCKMVDYEERAMPLIIIIAIVTAMKFFEVWKFAEISWWYVVGLMVFAFIWFEFIEKIFGLDRKKEHNVDEERRKARIKQQFEKKK